jgi:transposase
MHSSAILLFEDETMLRLFPVLRRAWSLSGEPATIGISGQNAKRALFGAINVRTGHRIAMLYEALKQSGFQQFLRLIRCSYPGRPITILLDAASAHTAPASRALATTLNIELIWLPKQCPELNAMDHLFKALKADISANYQYKNIDQHASSAKDYILKLSNKQARTLAGILSKNFWLRKLL